MRERERQREGEREREQETEREDLEGVGSYSIYYYYYYYYCYHLYARYLQLYRCPRRKGQNFGRVFLMLKYTDITQNTYIQS